MVILNKHFVPRFKMRRNRSGIINLSSCMAVFPAPFVGIYPATKAYVDVMSRIITK
jgi:short-subunit dehydrogenase